MVKLTKEVVLRRARSHSLESVKKLNCWNSKLTDVSMVSELENVEVISASTNCIDSLEAFAKCSSLRELYLRRNSIKNLEEVLHLRSLPNLRVLWLSGNPCCKEVSEDKYRMTVIKALPSLTKLDNVVITQEEFKRSKIEGDNLKTSDNSPEVTKECDGEISLGEGDHIEKDETESCEKAEADTDVNASLPGSVIQETNELRKQLGFKPLPPVTLSTGKRTLSESRTMGQTTTSVHVLTASLALIRDMDEEALMTLRDAINSRLYVLEQEAVCITSCIFAKSNQNVKRPQSASSKHTNSTDESSPCKRSTSELA